jgi:F-type H+-transporting ATPase subunit delta
MNAGETAIRLGDIYARTVFELADESGSIDAVGGDMAAIGQVLAENPEFGSLLGSPWFNQQYKMDLLRKLFSGKVADLTLDFLMVAAGHDRLTYLPQMTAAYHQLWEARQGLQAVRATVSDAASETRVRQFAAEIAEILQSKVKLEVVVDPSIMGGVVLRYEDKVIDNSVRTRLRRAIATIMKRQDMQG